VRRRLKPPPITRLSVLMALALLVTSTDFAQTPSAPDPATAHFAAGFDQLKAGNASAAAKEFNAGLELQPENAMAWFYLGEARLKLGLTELAQAAYQKSLDLDPKGQQSDAARTKLAQLNPSAATVAPVPPQAQPAAAITAPGAAGLIGLVASSQAQNAGAASIPNKLHLSAQLVMLHDLSSTDVGIYYQNDSGKVKGSPIVFHLRDATSTSLLTALRQHFATAEDSSSVGRFSGAPDVVVQVDVTDTRLRIKSMHFTGNDFYLTYSVAFSVISSDGKRVSKTARRETDWAFSCASCGFMPSVAEIQGRIPVAVTPKFTASLEAAYSEFLNSAEVLAFLNTVTPNSQYANTRAPAAAPLGVPAAQTLQAAPKADVLTTEDQAHFDTVLKSGRPSQMYLLAVKMYTEHHVELGDKLCQAIVDRYPDDPYAAKAIDRLDSARQGAERGAQQQAAIQQQQAAFQQQAAYQQEANDKRITACHTQCSAQKSMCDSRGSAQTNQSLFGMAAGVLNHSPGQIMGSAAGSSSGENCSSALTACEAGCL